MGSYRCTTSVAAVAAAATVAVAAAPAENKQGGQHEQQDWCEQVEGGGVNKGGWEGWTKV